MGRAIDRNPGRHNQPGGRGGSRRPLAGGSSGGAARDSFLSLYCNARREMPNFSATLARCHVPRTLPEPACLGAVYLELRVHRLLYTWRTEQTKSGFVHQAKEGNEELCGAPPWLVPDQFGPGNQGL
jgi:hypothetical protein